MGTNDVFIFSVRIFDGPLGEGGDEWHNESLPGSAGTLECTMDDLEDVVENHIRAMVADSAHAYSGPDGDATEAVVSYRVYDGYDVCAYSSEITINL